MPDRIRVLCVDDHDDTARLYERLVASQPDMSSAGILGSADELVSEVSRLRPDIVVLDLTMPGRNPLEALAELTAALPAVRVIVFTGHDDPRMTEAVWNAGAWGLVSKHGEPFAVLDAIRGVARGETWFPDGTGKGHRPV